MAYRLFHGRAWVGCGLGWLFVLTSCSGGTSSSSTATEPELKGFQLYSELGRSCRAAVDLSPADHYGNLSFIPCTSGESGCEQLTWDGFVSLLDFSLQPGFASTGELRYILVTRQYPTKTTEGIPFEAVVYDASSGVPVAAFRNPGDAFVDDDAPGSDGSFTGRNRDCLLNVAITSDTAIVLARRSGSNDIVLNQAPLEQAASVTTFSPLEADSSVFRRPILGSGTTAAFEQEDGKLFLIDTASAQVQQSYGPALRLWLSGVAGDDVLARALNPSVDGYYWFHGSDSFEHISTSAPYVLADATRLIWVEDGETVLNVHAAPRSAPDPVASAQLIATIPHSSRPSASVLGVTLGEGVLAVHSIASLYSPAGSDLYLVTLETGAVRHRPLAGSNSVVRLLANSRTHAFMGQSAYLLDDATQYEALVRYALQ